MLAAALGLVTLAVYAPTLGNGFVQFDDPGYVTANPHVQAGLTAKNAGWAFTTFDQGNWHPLTWLSHMLDVQLYGLQPAGHHATSILLHALNAILLFLLLAAATRMPWRSLLVAALFALHPINVETVAWVAERKSLLCMFFSLVTVGLYGWYARAPHWRRYLAVVFAFALALMSKPMAVTLPVVLLLVDFWPLGRMDFSDRSTPALPRLWTLTLEMLPLFAMSLASSWVTIVAQKHSEAISDLVRLPLWVRFENAALAYTAYLRKMVWPTDLAYFYPHRGLNVSGAHAALAALFLIAISLLVARFRTRRHLVFGWLFFLVTLLPVIGILQVGLQSMADRYAYLPFLGLFTAVVWELADLASRPRFPVAVAVSAIILLLVLAADRTITTESYWRSSVALFTRAHEVTQPPNLFIETNLAAALLDEGRATEALYHFRVAEQLAPGIFAPHYNVGYLLARQGEFDGAVVEFQAALACPTEPSNQVRALNSLGIAYLNLGRRNEALTAFTRVLALDPGNASVKAHIDALRQK